MEANVRIVEVLTMDIETTKSDGSVSAHCLRRNKCLRDMWTVVHFQAFGSTVGEDHCIITITQAKHLVHGNVSSK
jgi:hypothetical protein